MAESALRFARTAAVGGLRLSPNPCEMDSPSRSVVVGDEVDLIALECKGAPWAAE